MFDIIGKRKIFYWISLLTTIPGLVFILLTPFTDAGLQFTIDFTGGTRWEVRFEDETVTPEQVEAVFAAEGLDAAVVSTSSGYMEIKTEPIGLQEAPSESPGPSGSPGASASPSGSAAASASAGASASTAPSASPAPSASVDPSASPSADPSASPSAPPATGNTELPTDGQLGELVVAMESELGPIGSQASLTTIGPVVSADLTGQALRLILVGSVAILLWITYRFRDVKFGVTALVALLHDVILVVGVFAILGTFFRVEVDALFVTGMLTVIGFSVHDTIVVFDRVRENKARHVGEPLEEIVNHSILQTFGRSIMTSFTVFITLLALLLFGGAAINNFILILLVGITAGTYSSIFVASPLLVDWHRWEDRRHGRTEVGRSPRPRRATP
jgi:preprotein translocase SecF subunit